MARMNRQQRKEEEKRIIAEMDAAMQEQKNAPENTAEIGERGGQVCDETSKNNVFGRKKSPFIDVTPEQVHCKRCKTLMEKGVCPKCGFRIYVPMAKEKHDKIRLWVTIVSMVAFVIIFVALQISKS